ncbi:MAG: nitroreductase family protein [Lentisphaeria bacterium]|nr:nitroreductase family protein [Lentisphaeria bacterium]
MDFSESVLARRSIRRYRQQPVGADVLRQLIEFARVAPSGRNAQSLRFCVISRPELVKSVFDLTAWAGYVTPRRSPVWGKDAPPCFIAVTTRQDVRSTVVHADAGAAIENILLGAASLGLGTCWIGAFDKEKVRRLLPVAEGVEVLYLVAVGYPAETPVLEDAPGEDRIRYYLDEEDRLHVPKLTADDLTTWA